VRGEDASGELFVPAQTPAPLVFVLHTAWGHVSPNDRQYARMLAQSGFVAFAIEYPLTGGPAWVPYVVQNSKCEADARGRAVAWFRTYLK
jgi:hypothetical protein